MVIPVNTCLVHYLLNLTPKIESSWHGLENDSYPNYSVQVMHFLDLFSIFSYSSSIVITFV